MVAPASRVVLCASICLLAAAVSASAQAPASNAPTLPVVPIQWPGKQPYPDAGKLAVYQGETDAVGVAFTIPPGTVFSRCAIVVAAVDNTSPITVRLKNELSTRWDRVETTGANGRVEIKYRTEGGAMVMLQSPAGRQRYQLMVLQGKELPVHRAMKPPFVTKAQAEGAVPTPVSGAAAPQASPPASSAPSSPAGGTADADSGSGRGVVLWVIAGLLAAIAVLGLVLVLKRRSS